MKEHKSRLRRDCLCHWKDTSYNSILVIIDRLMLEEFIDEFHDEISTKKASVTIQPWLTRMVHDKPVQIPIDAPRLPQLDCRRLKLSLHLQVLVPPGITFELNYVYHLRASYENI